jgi:hypothetical protein
MNINDFYCLDSQEGQSMNLVTLYKRAEITKFEILCIIMYFTHINQPLTVPDFMRICYIFKNLGRLSALEDDFIMKKGFIKSRGLKELLKALIINDLVIKKGCRLFCYFTLTDLEKFISFLDYGERLRIVNIVYYFLNSISSIPYRNRINFTTYLFRTYNFDATDFNPILEQENLGIMKTLISSILLANELVDKSLNKIKTNSIFDQLLKMIGEFFSKVRGVWKFIFNLI